MGGVAGGDGGHAPPRCPTPARRAVWPPASGAAPTAPPCPAWPCVAARHRARRGRLRASALGAPGLVALLAGLLAAGGVVLLALRRLGGFTGDVLGAAGFLCETAGLVVATAWS